MSSALEGATFVALFALSAARSFRPMELTFLELASSPSSGAGHPPNPSSLRPLYALHASRAPTALKHDRPPLQPFPSRLELNALLHALPNSQTSLPISPHPPRRLCARLYHPHSRDVPREGLRRLPRCEGVEHLGVGGQERQVAAWVRAVRASAAQVGRSGRGDGYLWRAFLLLSLSLSPPLILLVGCVSFYRGLKG